MTTVPVMALLLLDLFLFLAAIFYFDKSAGRWDSLLLSGLFFWSGMPALIYQIVWQRVLFAIYGVNAESVAVVVSAFMLGLGLGSLVGGWLSSRFPKQGILYFGLAEMGVAAFGLGSLHLFHWAALYTAGADLSYVIVFSLLLLIVPTMLMGATLPLLVGQLVRHSGRVGHSVAMLYFVNTFGSAVACFFCASFLLRDFGQSGSVAIAACLNTLVGATAYLYGRRGQTDQANRPANGAGPDRGEERLRIGFAMLIAGLSGLIALGFEIAWFRVFAMASSDRAPAFALLLATYLAGIAAGSYVTEKLTERRRFPTVIRLVGLLMVLAGVLSVYLPPLVGFALRREIPFLACAPAFFLTAALLGSVLPLLCQVTVSADERAGRGVSLVYLSNIIGATLGSLLVGFVLTQYFGLRQVSMQLGMAAVLAGSVILLVGQRKLRQTPVWAAATLVLAVSTVLAVSGLFSGLFERLIFHSRPEADMPLARVVENRNGVIGVTRDGAVFGGGVYDGHFNIDPTNDVNFVVRAYSLSAFHPAPRRILMIGLASGSWAQIVANHPQLESLDIVEINPGHLELIPQYAVVRSLLQNPKVRVEIDDGRRWLLSHVQARYDIIVANTSFHWRDHSSYLLSTDFLGIIRMHLNPGGVYYYNTTESDDVMATGLRVFPYGLRVLNCLALSDSPIRFDKDRWLTILRQYEIDKARVFDPANPRTERTLAAYMALADSLNYPPRFLGFETSDSIHARLGNRLIITDDNMGWEWRTGISIPWHDRTR